MKKAILLFVLPLFLAGTAKAQLLLPVFEEPQKLDALNSEAEESMPLPYNKGERMFFVRTLDESNNGGKRGGQDIWYSQRIKGAEWEEPHNDFKGLNTRANNAIIGSNADGTKIYIFNSLQTPNKSLRGISYSVKDGNKWGDPVPIDIPGLRIGAGYYSFYMNPAENILMIAMPPSDTTTNEDLYVSVKGADGKWQAVIDLGPQINTDAFELSPYIAEDGKTMYFSSNGHGGMGDADVFVSRRLDDSWTNWTKPLNLGAPINSTAFDAYFIIGNAKEVYFTSNRGGELSDIYYTKQLKEPRLPSEEEDSVEVNGLFVYNGLPQEGVKLNVYNEDGDLVKVVYTDKDGRYKYNKLDGEGNYLIKVAEEDMDDYGDGKLYLTDETGTKRMRYNRLAMGSFTLDEVPNDGDSTLVKGTFVYNNLPVKNSGLVVLDESGFPIDTFYTDDAGKFEFYRLGIDDSYTLLPMEVNEEDFENHKVILDTDDGTTMAMNRNDNNQTFTFKKPSDEVAVVDPGKGNPIVVKKEPKKPADRKEPKKITKDDSNVNLPPIDAEYIIYFDFNIFKLDTENRSKLNQVAARLKADKQLKVQLIGHTDNVGAESINQTFSEARAESGKRYLIAKGVDANRISTKGMGESQPIEDNSTAEGRAKNRRLEIEFQ